MKKINSQILMRTIAASLLCFLTLQPAAVGAAAYAETATMFEDAFSPRQGATELVVKTINEAKKSVHVAAYSFTSKPIAEALITAHDKGVDVEVVLDKSQRNGRMVQYIKDHGIPTRINDHYAIMHDKFIVIDEKTLELGSFNYTAAAEKRNAENVLVLHGAGKIVEDYSKQWEKLWGEAK
ncbi:MAG: phospholipase D family protein [Proteobacteria bacterium]|nr:phospholipase D family protein [Pseudomonadota bacterium]